LDNVSHTIAGLLLAEAVVQVRARQQAQSARFVLLARVLSAAANNLPDLDSLYAGITEPRSLGYLLHHRGHTHTLIGALALAALMTAAVQFALRGRSQLARADWLVLWGLSLAGGVAHMAMDFTNNYGVHPFWPVRDGWLYGDFVFIIEPFFFVLGVPPLLFALRSRVARVLLGASLAAVLVAAWTLSWVPPGAALVVSLLTALSLVLAYKLDPLERIKLTCVAAFGVVVVFLGTHFAARARAAKSLPAAAVLHDLVLTPMPANPLCWSVWRVSTEDGKYVAERGAVAAVPSLLPVGRCRVEPDHSDPTAPLTSLNVEEVPAVLWTARYVAPVAELGALARDSCHFAAFLRFARVPYWAKTERGRVAGDLRYDRDQSIEFAELRLPDGAPCPRWVPSWLPPRHELLDAAAGSALPDAPGTPGQKAR
jgi:inner membrane protein